MKFKHYDILSQVVIGYVILVVLIYFFDLDYDNKYSVAYLAIAFVIGYLVNALSSFLDKFYHWTIGGKPSSKLLQIHPKKKHTGIGKVRFYHAEKIILLLKEDVEDENADENKMFGAAMRLSNSDESTRVPDFNAHYAFSRVMLTAMIILALLLIVKYYNNWQVYLIIFPLLLCWVRYKERGYYYAREVLNEYLKTKTTIK